MTESIASASHAADNGRHTGDDARADTATPDVHGMKPVAMAFVVGNAAVLTVFALVAATGHLDLGLSGFGDVVFTTATAAPTR